MAFEGTVSVKLPSKSVTVPLLVPFCWTVAPIRVSPASSVTVPCTVMSCASTIMGISSVSRPMAKRFDRNCFILFILIDIKRFENYRKVIVHYNGMYTSVKQR